MSTGPLAQTPHIYYVRDKLFTGTGSFPSGNFGLYLSANDGNVTWTNTPIVRLSQTILNHLKVAGPAANPSVIAPFSTGAIGGNTGLVRINNAFDGIASNEDVNPVALPPQCRLGTYGAQWINSVHSFGVDPKDANFIILPDVLSDRIYISTDGGTNWVQRDDLRDLITDHGKYHFHIESIPRINFELSGSQVTSITFDPLNTNRILIGTTEAGAIYSPDHGTNWYRIKGSEMIPNITCFAFNQVSSGEAVVSSWGRGLWIISLDISKSSGMGSIFPAAYAQKNRNYKIVPGDKSYANKLYYDTLSPVLYFQSKQGITFKSIVGGTEVELIGKRWLKTNDKSNFIFDLDNHIVNWKEFLLIENNSFRLKMPLFNVPGGHKLTVIEKDNHGNKLESTLYFNILASDER